MIDYTARDEASLIAEADAYALELLPEWTIRDDEDINWVTLKTVARLMAISNFYVDLSYNESFPTAQLYPSLLLQAKRVNMPVKRRSGAVATLTVNRDSSAGDHTIVRGTSFSSTKGDYYVLEDIVMPSGDLSINVLARFGDYVSGTIATSNGASLQSYIISDTTIQKDTLKIFVGGVGWVEELDSLAMADASNTYKIWLEKDETLRIDFGDGVFGNIPTTGAEITYTALSLKTQDFGRVPALNITSSSDGILTRVVQPAASIGGEWDESASSISTALKEWGAVQNRIVMGKDCVFMAKRYPGVYDAKIRTDGLKYDLFVVTPNGDPTQPFLDAVEAFLNKRKLDVIDLDVRALVTNNIRIKLTLTINSKYTIATVENLVKDTLYTNINNSLNAGKDVTLYDVYGYLSPLRTKGVDKLTITNMYRDGFAPTLGDIIYSDAEKAFLPDGYVEVVSTGGL